MRNLVTFILISLICTTFCSYHYVIAYGGGNCSIPPELKPDYDKLTQKYNDHCVLLYLLAKAKHDNTSLEEPQVVDKVANLSRVYINHIKINEIEQNIQLMFTLVMTWRDKRLSWSNDITNEEHANFDGPKFWYPLLHTLEQPVSKLHGWLMRNGTVKMFRSARTDGGCKFDYRYYPNDEHKCCYKFWRPTEEHDISYNVTTELTWSKSNYVLDSLWTNARFNFERSKKSSSVDELCFTFRRSSASTRVQHVLPLLLVAFLTVVIPQFMRIKAQIVVKSICFLVQLACMFNLTNSTHVLHFGSSVPQLLRFYELFLIATAVSLLVTVILYNMCQRQYRLPPPALLETFGRVINLFFICGPPQAIEIELTDPPTSESTAESQTKYRESWAIIWRAVNNIFACLTAFVYIMGAICLTS